MIKLDMILTIVLVLVVITIVASLTVLYMKRPSQSNALYDLSSSQTTVLQRSSLPWDMTTPSCLRFAVYINSAPKTVSSVGNCMNIADTKSLSQLCNDYSYTTCMCNDVSCSNCTISDTQLTPLVNLGSTVNLLVSGYVAQTDKPLVSTLLTIKTSSSANTHVESISLPAIPLQKWTVVSIVQEGRRIDVYYGAKSVASTYLKYSPIPANASDAWAVGGMTGWVGKIGLFGSWLQSRTSDDVANDVSQLVDTTGLPHAQNEMDFSFNLNLPSCLFGTCPGLPALKAPNPFSVYASSVS